MNADLQASMTVRDVRPTDLPFILDSWCRSYRESKFAGTVTNDEYPSVQRNTIEQLMARGAKYIVACSKHDRDQILGWVCWEKVRGGVAVHYLYVKDPYRRLGLGSYLLELAFVASNCSPEARKYYTHRTAASGYGKRTFCEWYWSPEIARRKSSGAEEG